MKELGVRKGYEHLDAEIAVGKAFEDGDPEALDAAEKHPHPAVSGRYLAYALEIGKQLLRRNKGLALGAAVLGVGLFAGIKIKAGLEAHEASAEKAWGDFAAVFKDPLSVEFAKTLKYGETAVKEGPAEQFIANLCDASIKRPKEAINFWTGLNPYHPIFLELLHPDTRHPTHKNPTIQTRYQERIDQMTKTLGLDPEKPKTVRVIREKKEMEILATEVKTDDFVLLKPGTVIKRAINGKLDRWRKAAGSE